MTQELLYTSAPRGLKPGVKGFCTVASTAGMATTLADRLESLSGYRHLYPPHDRQAQLNPVQYSHLIVKLGGQVLHVLSRVCDAGLDYSQRSNKLAHHIALTEAELVPAGPAWLLGAPGFMETSFVGEPRILPAGRQPPPGASPPRVCRAWEAASGDAGWAGVLAETAAAGAPKIVNVIYPIGTAVLPLVEEALSLLPARGRWAVTFSTYYTKLPPGIDCHWRFLVHGQAEAKTARRTPQIPLIDLASQLGPAEGGPLVSAARTGQAPELAVFAERAFRNVESGFGGDGTLAPSASAIARRHAAAPASRQAPPQLWPTSAPSFDRPPGRWNTKRICTAAGRVLGILIVVVGAFTLGELHGRRSPELPAPAPAIDAVAAGAPITPAVHKPEVEVKSQDDPPKATMPAAVVPVTVGDESGKVASTAGPKTNGQGTHKELGSAGKTVATPAPPGPGPESPDGKEERDAREYGKRLTGFWNEHRFVVAKLDVNGFSSLGIPARAGIVLELEAKRAKWWDRGLNSISLEFDPQNQSWTARRDHTEFGKAKIAQFAIENGYVAGKLLPIDSLGKATNTPVENLLDCYLIVKSGATVPGVNPPSFGLRPDKACEPLKLTVKLDDPSAKNGLKLLSAETIGRALPEDCNIRIEPRSPPAGFELDTQARTLGLREATLDQIGAVFQPDKRFALRFKPSIEKRRDGTFRVIVEPTIFVAGLRDLPTKDHPVDVPDLAAPAADKDIRQAGVLAASAVSNPRVYHRLACGRDRPIQVAQGLPLNSPEILRQMKEATAVQRATNDIAIATKAGPAARAVADLLGKLRERNLLDRFSDQQKGNYWHECEGRLRSFKEFCEGIVPDKKGSKSRVLLEVWVTVVDDPR